MCSLLVVFLIGLFDFSNGQLLGLSEGAGCGSSGGVCKRLRHCPAVGNPRQTRPLICSFIDREPVVCCPSPKSKALEMCMLYDRMACSGVDVARRRRQVEEELDLAKELVTKIYESEGTNIYDDQFNQTRDEMEMSTESEEGNRREEGNLTEALTKPELMETTTFKIPTTGKTTCSSPTVITPLTINSSTSSTTTAPARPSTAPVEEAFISNATHKEVDSPRMLPPGFSLSSVSDNVVGETKIVGGTEATARELPYMALIGFGVGSSKEWSCGASIISENFVMSAAHCAKNPVLGAARWARVAELDLTRDNSPHLDIPIIARFVHPEYKEPAVYNDIALFRLGTRLVFSSWVQPLCLQVASDIIDRKGVAAGWGRTDFVGDTSERLLKVDLTLVDSAQCRNVLGRAGRFLPQGVNMDTMICAGEVQGGKDTCTGDSGGPLVIQGSAQCLRTQVGIVSFGRECAKPNTPGIYTKVSSFIPWIESIVWP